MRTGTEYWSQLLIRNNYDQLVRHAKILRSYATWVLKCGADVAADQRIRAFHASLAIVRASLLPRGRQAPLHGHVGNGWVPVPAWQVPLSRPSRCHHRSGCLDAKLSASVEAQQ